MVSDELVARIRSAWASGDLSEVASLLDPDVTWGAPDDPNPACRNRSQVVAWYERSLAQGVRGAVIDVSVVGDDVLVGLLVTGTEDAEVLGGAIERWQLLTIRNGRIVDIRGYEDRASALAAARPVS